MSFYQAEAVSEKVQPRTLRAGVKTLDGKLISDRHVLVFDETSDDPRKRETPVRFILSSSAEGANNQDVLLVLEEQFGATEHYQTYKAERYTIRRSFNSDFFD